MKLRNPTTSEAGLFSHNVSGLTETATAKPRLLFFRKHGDLPAFILSQLEQHVKCLSLFFDVQLVEQDGDYQEICERFQPDLTLVESGVYGSPPAITNKSSCPEVPKLGFLNADAYCPTRSRFLADMEHWGIESFFTISVSMPEYLPNNTDQLFIWPNFIDPEIYRDYGRPKNIPVLTTGSQAMHYPWRTRINELAAQQYPSLVSPHFGWFDAKKAASMIYDHDYAKLINSAWVVPTCGTVAREVVRKHFEIPACNACLVTERTAALEDAGFVDMENCVFVTEFDVLDKLDNLFSNPGEFERIWNAGRLLVHSRHTSFQRDQILQWYHLNRVRRPGQKIIQPRPFGPLVLVDQTSTERNYQSPSNSMDRAILREGHQQLRCGNYGAADRSFLSCLNYHRMPEPMLGLAKSALKRGNPSTALEWMSRLLKCAFEVDGAIEPDPIEWSHYVISLLCNGNIREAKKRVDEFPLLRHHELDRCRWALGIISRATELRRPNETSVPRSSIHRGLTSDIDDWIRDLVDTLTRCRQTRFAQSLLTALEDHPASAPHSTLPADHRHIDFHETPSRETFAAKIRRRAPKTLRSVVSTIRTRMNHVDPFSSIVSTWAQKEQIERAVLLGASDRSVYSQAFLSGIAKNPLMPHVSCVSERLEDCTRLQRDFRMKEQIQFFSNSFPTVAAGTSSEPFGLVFIDRCELDELATIQTISGARSVLICDINTRSGRIAKANLPDDRYRISYNQIWKTHHSIGFTRLQRDLSSLREAGRKAELLAASLS